MADEGVPGPDRARTSRALRKYEAGTDPVGADRGSPPVEFLSPFGPLVGRTTVPETLLARLNAWAEAQTQPGRSTEFLVPPEIAALGGAESLHAVLTVRLRRYCVAAEGTAPRRIAIERIWVVSQVAGTASPMHFHSGDLSGVLYLRAPPAPPAEAELQKSYISGRQAGWLNFIASGKQRFARTVLSVPPDVGTLFVFPAWLLHGAEPFRGSGERRSLAFNARAESEE